MGQIITNKILLNKVNYWQKGKIRAHGALIKRLPARWDPFSTVPIFLKKRLDLGRKRWYNYIITIKENNKQRKKKNWYG